MRNWVTGSPPKMEGTWMTVPLLNEKREMQNCMTSRWKLKSREMRNWNTRGQEVQRQWEAESHALRLDKIISTTRVGWKELTPSFVWCCRTFLRALSRSSTSCFKSPISASIFFLTSVISAAFSSSSSNCSERSCFKKIETKLLNYCYLPQSQAIKTKDELIARLCVLRQFSESCSSMSTQSEVILSRNASFEQH